MDEKEDLPAQILTTEQVLEVISDVDALHAKISEVETLRYKLKVAKRVIEKAQKRYEAYNEDRRQFEVQKRLNDIRHVKLDEYNLLQDQYNKLINQSEIRHQNDQMELVEIKKENNVLKNQILTLQDKTKRLSVQKQNPNVQKLESQIRILEEKLKSAELRDMELERMVFEKTKLIEEIEKLKLENQELRLKPQETIVDVIEPIVIDDDSNHDENGDSEPTQDEITRILTEMRSTRAISPLLLSEPEKEITTQLLEKQEEKINAHKDWMIVRLNKRWLNTRRQVAITQKNLHALSHKVFLLKKKFSRKRRATFKSRKVSRAKTVVKLLDDNPKWHTEHYLTYPSGESDGESADLQISKRKRLKKQKNQSRLSDSKMQSSDDEKDEVRVANSVGTIYEKQQGSVDSGYIKTDTSGESESKPVKTKLATLFGSDCSDSANKSKKRYLERVEVMQSNENSDDDCLQGFANGRYSSVSSPTKINDQIQSNICAKTTESLNNTVVQKQFNVDGETIDALVEGQSNFVSNELKQTNMNRHQVNPLNEVAVRDKILNSDSISKFNNLTLAVESQLKIGAKIIDSLSNKKQAIVETPLAQKQPNLDTTIDDGSLETKVIDRQKQTNLSNCQLEDNYNQSLPERQLIVQTKQNTIEITEATANDKLQLRQLNLECDKIKLKEDFVEKQIKQSNNANSKKKQLLDDRILITNQSVLENDIKKTITEKEKITDSSAVINKQSLLSLDLYEAKEDLTARSLHSVSSYIFDHNYSVSYENKNMMVESQPILNEKSSDCIKELVSVETLDYQETVMEVSEVFPKLLECDKVPSKTVLTHFVESPRHQHQDSFNESVIPEPTEDILTVDTSLDSKIPIENTKTSSPENFTQQSTTETPTVRKNATPVTVIKKPNRIQVMKNINRASSAFLKTLVSSANPVLSENHRTEPCNTEQSSLNFKCKRRVAHVPKEHDGEIKKAKLIKNKPTTLERNQSMTNEKAVIVPRPNINRREEKVSYKRPNKTKAIVGANLKSLVAEYYEPIVSTEPVVNSLESPISTFQSRREEIELPTSSVPESNKRSLSSAQAKALIEQLLHFPQSSQVAQTVTEVFLHENPDYIAQLVLYFVAQDVQGSVQAIPSKRVPLLTKTQRIMLGFLMELEDRNVHVMNRVLTRAEEKMFTLRTAKHLEPIARMHAAICKLRFDYKRMRLTMYRALAQMGDLVVPYISVVVYSWLELIPCKSELMTDLARLEVRTFMQILKLKQCANADLKLINLLQSFLKYHGYPLEMDKNDEMLEKLFAYYIGRRSESVLYLTIALIGHFKKENAFFAAVDKLKRRVDDTKDDEQISAVIRLVGIATAQVSEECDRVKANKVWLQNFSNESYSEYVRDTASCVLQQFLPEDDVTILD